MQKQLMTWLLAIWCGPAAATVQELVTVKVERPPVLDGRADDEAWRASREITVADGVDNVPITLRSVYTEDRIYFLVSFEDPAPDRKHKAMRWDPEQGRYRTGPAREDAFVFKWSMEGTEVDLRSAADAPYMADVWYWKAERTDHAGYADDKMHILSEYPLDRATRAYSRSGRLFYLIRPGDAGRPAYRNATLDDFVSDEVSRYVLQMPEGSRADVRAKGEWSDGRWTIEFSRKLDTGNVDDVQFRPGESYRFGVTRFEIAGKKPDPSLEQPNYGAGDIAEHLALVFR